MFDQLKPLIQSGERYIIVENGKPEFVMMRFADYVILNSVQRVRSGDISAVGDLASINADLASSRPPTSTPAPELQSDFDSMTADIAPDPGSVRLEDLPL